MTRNIRRANDIMENENIIENIAKVENNNAVAEEALPLVHESCKYSNFSFAVAVSGLIAFVGILVYALVI